MKRIVLVLLLAISAPTAFAQGFGLGFSAGYLSEIDGFGGSADLIYEFNEKFGVSTNATFSQADNQSLRRKWWIMDLNLRYKVIDQWYVFAGGEYLSQTFKELGLGGGNPIGGTTPDENATFFGANIGTGYKYNLMDNVNLFADVKYVAIESGYVHTRLGIQFDF